MAYLYDTSDKPEGYGGGGGGNFDNRSALLAHGHPHRRRQVEARARVGGIRGRRHVGGILTTAGRLLFTGDSGHLVAFDPADGKIAVEPANDLGGEQRAIDVDAGRQTVSDRGRRRYAVRAHAGGETMKVAVVLGLTAAAALAQDAGQRVFETTCGRCHGADGRGGEDGALDRGESRLVRQPAAHDSDPSGAAGARHAAHMVGDDELAGLIRYVRRLGREADRPPEQKLTGDELGWEDPGGHRRRRRVRRCAAADGGRQGPPAAPRRATDSAK